MSDGVLPAGDANRPEPGPASSSRSPAQPLRELLDTLDRARPAIAEADPALDRQIHALRDRADRPGTFDHPGFRARVAYAFTDFEKLAGPVPSVPAALREELTALAGTVPGLRNERMQELMRATPGMQDQNLVRDIRTVAHSVASLKESQDTAPVRSMVENLENKVRLSTGAEIPAAAHAAGRAEGGQPEEARGGAGTAADRAGAAAGDFTRVRAAVSPGGGRGEGIPSPGSAVYADRPSRSVDHQPQQHQQQTAVAPSNAPYVRGPGALANIMAAMTRPPPATTPPWEGPPTPMAERLGRFQERMQQNREERGFEAAERAGRAAAEALQAFSQGPGAGVLAKIRDAAKSDPNGMQGVMAEMRDGGRYADLRAQFNSALVAEQGFAAAYDRAADALARYGKDRAGVEQVASARPDAASITARFARIDAEIGEAAGAVPARRDGKSLADELGEKTAELARRAVEAVKAILGRSAKADPRPSAGPSPSP